MGTGDFVKNTADTQGYAELQALYRMRLEEDKERFLQNKTAENAWQFFEDYSWLLNLRYKGEEQFLKMCKVKQFIFFETKVRDYDLKEEIVNFNKSKLETCRFNIPDGYKIPESIQYAKKSVINCPVDIDVYTQDGTLIASLKDGVISDITNEYGRFAVVKQSYTGEYAKVICQSTNDDLVIKMTAVSDGLVDYQSSEGETVNTFDKLSVSTGNKIEVADNSYYVDSNGDGIVEETGSLIEKNNNEYVAVSSIEINSDNINIYSGRSKAIGVTVIPNNATNTTVDWISSDESVATVQNGVVTGIKEGTAEITAKAVDSTGMTKSLTVTVVNPKGACGENTTWEISDNTLRIKGTGATYDYETENLPFTEFSDIIEKIVVSEGVSYIGNNMFSGLTNVTDIKLPKTLSAIGTNTFDDCTSLKNLVIRSSDLSVSAELFEDCSALKVKCYEGSASDNTELYPSQSVIEYLPLITIGDVNDDGETDVDDALLIFKYTVDLQELDDNMIQAADVNKDDLVDVDDALQIQKYIVDLAEIEQ